MSKRFELTTVDGEIIGFYAGDRVTHNIRGLTGTIVGIGDANTVRLKLDGDDNTTDVSLENFLDYWE